MSEVKATPCKWGDDCQWTTVNYAVGGYPVGVSVGDDDADYMTIEDAEQLYANLAAAINEAKRHRDNATREGDSDE